MKRTTLAAEAVGPRARGVAPVESAGRASWLWGVAVAGLLAVAPVDAARAEPPRLRVSDNQRFLTTADGQPFFYLRDTAWELFHRLTREEATRYLDDRAAKGFTVIQAVPPVVPVIQAFSTTRPNRSRPG